MEMMAAMTLLGEQKRISRLLESRGSGKEEFDVCQAIDELIADGRMAGKREGERIGKTRINSLNRKLKADGRIEELLRSVDDQLLQKKLLREYGL